MDLTELFTQFPYLREGLTAAVVIFVDICALTILIAAGRERRTGDRRWAKEGKGLMLTCGDAVYPLGAAELLIGRHPSADIHFPDDEVSRFHALITLRNGKWQIEDTGASNGVLVNGSRIKETRVLKRGDVITVGKRRLTVVKGAGKVVS